MREILPLLIIFGSGGLTMVAIAFSPVGRAIADKIRSTVVTESDPAVLEELERMRSEMNELHERVEFAERMLAKSRETEQLPGAQ